MSHHDPSYYRLSFASVLIAFPSPRLYLEFIQLIALLSAPDCANYCCVCILRHNIAAPCYKTTCIQTTLANAASYVSVALRIL